MNSIKHKIRSVEDSTCKSCDLQAYGTCWAKNNVEWLSLDSHEGLTLWPLCLPVEDFDKVKMEGY